MATVEVNVTIQTRGWRWLMLAKCAAMFLRRIHRPSAVAILRWGLRQACWRAVVNGKPLRGRHNWPVAWHRLVDGFEGH